MWSNIPLNTLTSSVLVPAYGVYENLVVNSVGFKRFNLLGSLSSSRAGMSSLGWAVSFSRCLVQKFVISALTVGISRSVCRTVFGTYHGALAMDLSTLFWNHCSISMLDVMWGTLHEVPTTFILVGDINSPQKHFLQHAMFVVYWEWLNNTRIMHCCFSIGTNATRTRQC
jgi:hypothetical protein